MSALDWYPRNSQKAIDGMRHLSLELRGAYNTLLDLIYLRGAPFPDNDRELAGAMGCSIRKWRSIRQALLDDGRIVARGEGKHAVLSDEYAEQEIEAQRLRRENKAENGAKGGRKAAENRAEPNEINGPEVAPLQLIQDSKKIEPPKPPLGADVGKADLDAIWSVSPVESRRRSGRKEVSRALVAAVRRGHAPAQILVALKAYFASDDATRDGMRWVKGVHRMIEDDRWEAFAERSRSSASEWTPDHWRSAVAMHVETGRWSDGLGPRPGELGCRAPVQILAELGFALPFGKTA